ncbi:MAG: hypothetical protein QG671_366 [Actinomycetota bacterium]|jgi:hypothetical protein|nr:hypothetical protein [Actinomycetota bacterium]HQZ85004.1 DUF6325 family protein [Actinomycetota bacterium]
MSVGPVDVVVVKFPGSQFNGEVGPALLAAVEQGDVRILDLVFIRRTSPDEVSVVELEDFDDAQLAILSDGLSARVDLLSDEDIEVIGEGLELGSSAVAVVFEHAWATRLLSAVRGSKGELLLDERIPAEVVAAALAATDES